jgi:hypothetical protein
VLRVARNFAVAASRALAVVAERHGLQLITW